MKQHPIIFLDVDGVLNSYATRPGDEGVRECELRPVNNPEVVFSGVVETAKVDALRRLVEKANARIVVSSSWRNAFHDAASFAGAIGIAPPLADAPDLFHKDWKTGWKFSSHRYHEIDWWLTDHRHSARYAILDDHNFIPHDWELTKHFVKTDPEHGLTTENLNKVCLLIGRADLVSDDWMKP